MSTFYEVEHGIPIPPIDRSLVGAIRGEWPRRPWDNMGIDDSFFVPRGDSKNESACASVAGQRRGMRFISRKITGGVRVWRIA
jgi:hypothetical protein